MQEYEICILHNDGSRSMIAIEILFSDHAAVRSAQRLAQGRKFEIWRGSDCIYGHTAGPVLRSSRAHSDDKPTSPVKPPNTDGPVSSNDNQAPSKSAPG